MTFQNDEMFYLIKKIVFGFLILHISLPIGHQLAKDRNWKKINYKKNWSVDVTKNQLYQPGRGMHVNKKGDIYIYDNSDRTIKMFNAKGKFIRSFGKEKGAGPGEVRNPIGFDIDEQDNVWVADPSNSRVTIFQNDGTFLKHIPLDIIPYRISVFQDGTFFYIINQGTTPDGKFTKFSKKGEIIEQFGSNIIDDQINKNIVLSGEITADNSGSVFYKPDYAGILIGFSKNGRELFRNKTVIPTPFPEVRFDTRGGSWVDRNANRVSRSIFILNNEKIAIFSQAASQEVKQAIDLYNKDTGEYLYSIKLPVKSYQIYLRDSTLYTLQYTTSEVSLSAWQITLQH